MLHHLSGNESGIWIFHLLSGAQHFYNFGIQISPVAVPDQATKFKIVHIFIYFYYFQCIRFTARE